MIFDGGEGAERRVEEREETGQGARGRGHTHIEALGLHGREDAHLGVRDGDWVCATERAWERKGHRARGRARDSRAGVEAQEWTQDQCTTPMSSQSSQSVCACAWTSSDLHLNGVG